MRLVSRVSAAVSTAVALGVCIAAVASSGPRLVARPLPDFRSGREVRAPHSPLSEEASAVRVMNAVRDHARRRGNDQAPIFSPFHVMLADRNPATFVDSRQAPPPGSGVRAASSEIFDVAMIRAAGYPVVPYTINDAPRMRELIALGVDGIISDRPDILLDVVRTTDADDDGVPGDFLDASGLVDGSRFDAQGHRGARNLRPENTLPAMEAALDFLMTTLETDTGLTLDRVAVLDHDAVVNSEKCRRADGAPYGRADEVLVRSLTAAQLQAQFICDRVFRGPSQTNDRRLSPATVSFAAMRGLPDPYVMPTVQQLFDFVAFYADFYAAGPGSSLPDAVLRAANARRMRFNIETKLNPRQAFRDRTFGPEAFVTALGGVIAANGLESRADIQSFDFRTLLGVHERFPAIRTVFLFGDFPIFDDPTVAGSDDGTNLQDEDGTNTPWLAGLMWPYRETAQSQPFRAQTSGGFEGMATRAHAGASAPDDNEFIVIEPPRRRAARRLLPRPRATRPASSPVRAR
jgi:glycerophosphoryl diester phosphodiesterase